MPPRKGAWEGDRLDQIERGEKTTEIEELAIDTQYGKAEK